MTTTPSVSRQPPGLRRGKTTGALILAVVACVCCVRQPAEMSPGLSPLERLEQFAGDGATAPAVALIRVGSKRIPCAEINQRATVGGLALLTFEIIWHAGAVLDNAETVDVLTNDSHADDVGLVSPMYVAPYDGVALRACPDAATSLAAMLSQPLIENGFDSGVSVETAADVLQRAHDAAPSHDMALDERTLIGSDCVVPLTACDSQDRGLFCARYPDGSGRETYPACGERPVDE